MTIIHRYGEHEAKIGIETLELIEGRLPRRALGLVLDWAELHRQELRDNWVRGKEHDALSDSMGTTGVPFRDACLGKSWKIAARTSSVA
jgi:hypothetical protein